MKIAVSSTDGKMVNQHFGHATRFLIYEWDGYHVSLLEERDVEQFCRHDIPNQHLYDGNRMAKIFNVIEDCEALITEMIGPTPKNALEKKGMHIELTYDTIENAILNMVNQNTRVAC